MNGNASCAQRERVEWEPCVFYMRQLEREGLSFTLSKAAQAAHAQNARERSKIVVSFGEPCSRLVEKIRWQTDRKGT
jgi:hypothetical protein